MSSIMTWTLDARIPVRALPENEVLPEGAVLLDGFEDTHVVGCACCVARSPGAVAFDRLFLARVKGERAFASVAVAPLQVEAVKAVIEADVVVRARFRWVPG